jgi:Putative peptidoglycan binding domain
VTIANPGLRHHVKQGRRSLSRRWEHAILKTIASSRYQFFCIPTTTQTMNAFEIALTQLDPILLAEGSRGRCIVILQKVLRLAGSYDGFVDGIFGPKTRTAIEVLQAYFELPVTGVFDSNLWYALSCDRTAPEAISADLKRASWYYQPSQICPSQVSSLLGRSESVAA